MTTIALKEQLINKISKIKDKNKLVLINDFIEQEETLDKHGALILTSEMKKIIEITKEQYKNGEFKTHQAVMAEADLWLKENA